MTSARKVFAEKVAEIMRDDKIDQNAAFVLAAERYPDLAAAYHRAGMAGVRQ